jgi:hypothetical protein
MILEPWQIDFISASKPDSSRKFEFVYEFVKKNQIMSSADFQNTANAVTDILDHQNVEYGILMLMNGFMVFTVDPLELDAVLVKLSTGINFEGQVGNASSVLARVNLYLGRKNTE